MTNEESLNPYAPPQLAATTEAETQSLDFRGGLRRRSIWLMILLSIVTAGLYINYWVHRYAVSIKHHVPSENVSMGVVWLFWIVSVTSLLWTIPEIYYDTPDVIRIGKFITRADWIFALVMAFAVRGGLNAWTGAAKKTPQWVHGFWTFVFGCFYLQWKVNRLLESGDISPQRAKSGHATSAKVGAYMAHSANDPSGTTGTGYNQ